MYHFCRKTTLIDANQESWEQEIFTTAANATSEMDYSTIVPEALVRVDQRALLGHGQIVGPAEVVTESTIREKKELRELIPVSHRDLIKKNVNHLENLELNVVETWCWLYVLLVVECQTARKSLFFYTKGWMQLWLNLKLRSEASNKVYNK